MIVVNTDGSSSLICVDLRQLSDIKPSQIFNPDDFSINLVFGDELTLKMSCEQLHDFILAIKQMEL